MISIDLTKQKRMVKYYAVVLGVLFFMGAVYRLLHGEPLYGVFLIMAACGTSLSLYTGEGKSFITIFVGVVIVAVGNNAQKNFGTDIGIYVGLVVFFMGILFLMNGLVR